MIKLIDCLEATFTKDSSTDKDVKSLNPVVEMFYGQYTVEGTIAGNWRYNSWLGRYNW